MKKQTITVEAIYEAREGNSQEHSTLMLRGPVAESNPLTTACLGGEDFERKGRVAFQTIKNDILAEKGIEEGSDFGEAMGLNLRLKVTETTDPSIDPDKFTENTIKENPETGEQLTKGGLPIYRVVEAVPVDFEGIDPTDVFVKHDTEQEAEEAEVQDELEVAAE